MKAQHASPGGFSIKTKFNLLLVAVAVVFIAALGFNYKNISPIQMDWETYLQQVVQRQTLLSDIQGQFGYGGAIHHFKNYVLCRSKSAENISGQG